MRLTRLAALAATALIGATATTPAPAAAAEGVDCTAIDVDAEMTSTTRPNLPHELLGVDRATALLEDRGTTPGEGVKVAVVDAGVDADAAVVPLRVSPVRFGEAAPLEDGHGMILAGLVAGGEREDGGPTGIAPGAEIVDVRVFDDTYADGTGGIPPERVVAALRWLAGNAEREGIGVVVTALDLPDSPGLERAVAALSREDVVIVAASGNRPQEGQAGFEEYGERAPGEDAVRDVHPAGYTEDVFAVTATADGVPVEGEGRLPDASGAVLLSSAIDAAVPVFGAVSVAGNGSTCVVGTLATSWAAGIAGGVVALVRSAYPDENADQIEARLRVTADGVAAAPTTATGAGVLQPVEALTQELRPTRDGVVDDMPREQVEQPRITAPEPPPDPVAGTLADARWWGLLGGAALVVALLLRPLLARRRDG